MLDTVIHICPETLWLNYQDYPIPYWQIAYHTLYYTALYISASQDLFSSYTDHQKAFHRLENKDFRLHLNIVESDFSKVKLLNYSAIIAKSVDTNILSEAFSQPTEISWMQNNKLETFLYNLRHLQHHIGQLVERLHQNGISGIEWT